MQLRICFHFIKLKFDENLEISSEESREAGEDFDTDTMAVQLEDAVHQTVLSRSEMTLVEHADKEFAFSED